MADTKVLDLSKSVAELVGAYPELADAMAAIGFTDITKPMALKLMGRVMTIPKGCAVKGFDLKEVVAKLEAAGFTCTGYEGAAPAGELQNGTQAGKEQDIADGDGAVHAAGETTAQQAPVENADKTSVEEETTESRNARLEGYIERLNAGESLESVQADFKAHFANVSPKEIAGAEQKLIQKGMPVADVQKLCDVHSALFHGMTNEQILAAEAGITGVNRDTWAGGAAGSASQIPERFRLKKRAKEEDALHALPDGHPVRVQLAENVAIAEELDKLEKLIAKYADPEALQNAKRNAAKTEGQDAAEGTQGTADAKDRFYAEAAAAVVAELRVLRGIRKHYAKKEELLMPGLYAAGITGPSDVMWGVDDEIFKEIGVLARSMDGALYNELQDRLRKVLARAREMIFKEEKILFPLALENLTDEDWYAAYRDTKEMGYAFPENPAVAAEAQAVWEPAEAWMKEDKVRRERGISGEGPKTNAEGADEEKVFSGTIQLPTGTITVRELSAVLDLLPIDITFIDANDRNKLFLNEGKFFDRPLTALGRPVYQCHPPVVKPIVANMLAEFKKGTADHVVRWIPNPENPVRIEYHAVHDREGNYIGTIEMVQQMGGILKELNTPKMPMGRHS